jgi:beta-lactamase class A
MPPENPETEYRARTARQLSRRSILGAAITGVAGIAALAAGCSTAGPPLAAQANPPSVDPALQAAGDDLARAEQRFVGRLGVCVVDTGSGVQVSHRPDERFLLCSTGKVLTVAAIQRMAAAQPDLLDRTIHFRASDVLEWAPATSQHLRDGMTVAQLCDAAITVSDNTAANLLVGLLGGPAAVTEFARSLGDQVTRVDRLEPDLNVTSPGDPRDTSTPAQMATNLRSLLLGSALPSAGRDRLTDWMRRNTTGAQAIRAGVPSDWTVADKTGAGAQGERNDVAVVWPPGRAPLIIAIYTAPDDQANPSGQAIIADAARIATSALIQR